MANIKRNFIWNTIGQLTYVAAQWLLTILVLRLSPDSSSALVNSGYLQTALTVTSLFLSVASFGMYNFQVSDATQKYAQSAYVRSRIYTCVGATLLCCGYLFAVSCTRSVPYAWQQIACVLLFLGYRLVESITDVYNAILQQHERLDLVGITYTLRGVLTVSVFAVCLLVTHSVVLTLLCMLLGNVLFFLLYTLRRTAPFYQKTSVTHTMVWALLCECAPLAIYTFLNTATASVPKLVLESTLGNEALGIYGPVTAPVLLICTCATYLFVPFLTTFSSCYASGNRKGFARVFFGVLGVVALLLIGGLFVAIVLGEWALKTFIDPSLAPYAYLLAPMVLCAVGSALVLFFSMVLTVMRRMKTLVVANCVAIVVSYVASVVLLPRYALQAPTYASCCALFVQLTILATVLYCTAKTHFATDKTC